MVILARESRGLSQAQLAADLSISAANLSRIEGGIRSVTDGVLARLAGRLDYPLEFFMQTDSVYGFGTSELFHHRKRKDVSAGTLASVHAQMNLRRMEFVRLLKGLEFVDVRIEPLDLDEFRGNVEDIARLVRASWLVPEGPIANVTDLIEDAGGIVIPLDFGTRRIDAISHWPPGAPPFFFVSLAIPCDRLRFTLAHELGHLVMHHQDPNPDMERQADRFAAEFLMPEREIRPYLKGITLPKLAALKPYWKVAMSALLRRALDLGEITMRQYRSLWVPMGSMGFRSKEPENLDIPMERPSLWREILDAYSTGLSYSIADFAHTFRLHEHEVKRLYFEEPRLLRALA